MFVNSMQACRKVIEWRRRRNIIVDEICPAYSDRAEIGSLKVQPQFSITTFPEELILIVYSWAFPISFPFRKKRYICCVETISVILFYFIFLFIIFLEERSKIAVV